MCMHHKTKSHRCSDCERAVDALVSEVHTLSCAIIEGVKRDPKIAETLKHPDAVRKLGKAERSADAIISRGFSRVH